MGGVGGGLWMLISIIKVSVSLRLKKLCLSPIITFTNSILTSKRKVEKRQRIWALRALFMCKMSQSWYYVTVSNRTKRKLKVRNSYRKLFNNETEIKWYFMSNKKSKLLVKWFVDCWQFLCSDKSFLALHFFVYA